DRAAGVWAREVRLRHNAGAMCFRQECREVSMTATSEGQGARSLRERVGFNVRRVQPLEAIEVIRAAEDAGIETIWMTMSASGVDTPTLFASAAMRTERIKLGTAIVPAFTRHPLSLATQALALHGLAPGRVRLGIGTSHGPSFAR